MTYKIIDNKLTKTTKTKTSQEVDAVYFDEKEKEIPIKVSVPIITFQEVSPDPVSQVVENMNHDLARIKSELDEKLAEYNAKVAEITAIKTDCPEIGLLDDTTISLSEKNNE
jgi:hypothetical protein